VAADTAKADAEMAKLTADLEELRQTLLRGKPTLIITGSASRRSVLRIPSGSTARVIEGLIPVIDGFEHALAAHASPNTTITARVLAYLQAALENLTKLGVERIDPVGKSLIRTCIRRWIALKQRTTQTAPFCCISAGICVFMGACCVRQWCV